MTNYSDEQKNAMWADIERTHPVPKMYQEGDITVTEVQGHYGNCDKETARGIMKDIAEGGDYEYLMVRKLGGGQKIAVLRKITN